MTTRLERLQASLQKEQKKADQKRLTKFREYLELAGEVIVGNFHDEAIEEWTRQKLAIVGQIAEDCKRFTS